MKQVTVNIISVFLKISILPFLFLSCIISSNENEISNQFNGFWIKDGESREWLQGIVIENDKVYLSYDDGCREKYFSHFIKKIADTVYTSLEKSFLKDMEMVFSGSKLTIQNDNHKNYRKLYSLAEFSKPLSPKVLCDIVKDPQTSIKILSNNVSEKPDWDLKDTLSFDLSISIENADRYLDGDLNLSAFNRIYMDNQYNKSYVLHTKFESETNFKVYIPIRRLVLEQNLEARKVILNLGIQRDGDVLHQTDSFLIRLRNSVEGK
jgi:hypothetical protein